MNWYRDISKNYGKLGLKRNPQWVFIKQLCYFNIAMLVILFVLMGMVWS